MDGVGSHKKFCDELELPFDLIADPEKKVHETYGFKAMVRALILIGKDGKILFVNKKFDLKDESWKVLMKEVEALKPAKK
jgi:thioredoxin-dependent peroxiredoxin